jgi:hypothetical protein
LRQTISDRYRFQRGRRRRGLLDDQELMIVRDGKIRHDMP